MAGDAEEYERLCQRLQEGDPSLTEIVLSKDVPVDSELVNALASNSLETLSIDKCRGFGDQVASAVTSLPALTTIRLRNADLSVLGARKLAASIKWEQLQEFDLQDNPKLGPRGISPFSEPFARAKELQVINLSNCRLGHFGAKTLGGTRLPTVLRVLDLSRNDIGNDGAWKLAPVLKDLSNLESLLLSKNQITDDGASEICRQIPSNLKTLDMSDNGVADVGAEAIAHVVEKSSLEKVVLKGNRIGDTGATALSDAIVKSVHLQEVDLSENNIGDEGATSLATRLVPTDNNVSVLTVLLLKDNQIGDEGAGAFVEHLDQNRTLVTLDLSENKGISQARQNILDMLLKHRKPRRVVDTTIETLPPSPPQQKSSEASILEEGRRLIDQNTTEFHPVVLSSKYLELCTRNFESQGIVSYGAFGELYRAKDGKRDFLVRRVSLEENEGVSEIRAQALKDMMELSHGNILPLKAYSTVDSVYYFVYDCDGVMSLNQCIGDNERRKEMTWRIRLQVLAGVSQALDYLHTGGLRSGFHGDIKSANVFVSSSYKAQLIDCGVSALVATDGARFQNGDVVFGSRGYRCPRYERGSRQYSPESDVFSFGIMMIEVCTGRRQNQVDVSTGGQRQDFYYDYIVDKTKDLSHDIDPWAGKWDKKVLASVRKMALACIDSAPMRRPGASTIAKVLDAYYK